MKLKKIVNLEGFSIDKLPYSHGMLISFSQMLITAGQVAINAQGEIIGKANIEAQTIQVMENLKYILIKSDMDFSNIVKVNMYLVNINDLSKVITIRNGYLKNNKPASTTIEVKGLANPDFLIEIELIAVK